MSKPHVQNLSDIEAERPFRGQGIPWDFQGSRGRKVEPARTRGRDDEGSDEEQGDGRDINRIPLDQLFR